MSREPHKYHEDAELFREALSYTQVATGFGARLVEKDYYCSLVLEDLLAVTNPQWVFKGGTCLSKVHSDFYRMSEDLDFAFSVLVDVPRAQRSIPERALGVKGLLADFSAYAPRQSDRSFVFTVWT